MKKTRGKKIKANSHKKINKPVLFFKRFFPILLIIGSILLIAIILNISSTGNAITGYASDELPAPVTTAPDLTTSNLFERLFNRQTSWVIWLIIGIAVLLGLIGIFLLIKKFINNR